MAGMAAGLLLDLSIAWRFGASASTDAYFAGTRVPLALGVVILVAANQALVPTFSWWREQRPDRADQDAGGTVVLATLASTVVAAVLVGFAPFVIAVTAPGFSAEQQTVAAEVLRITSLTIPLVMATEGLRAYLNARYAFVAPALMNVAYSGAALVVVVLLAESVAWIAWALVLGSVVRLAFLAVMARRRGFRPRLPMAWREDEREVLLALRRSGRPLATGAAPSAARLAEVVILSFLPAGSLSILTYGLRFASAAGGTAAFRSIMVALIPRIAVRSARGDTVGLRAAAAAGVALLLAAGVLIGAGLVGLSGPIASIVFLKPNQPDGATTALAGLLVILGLSLPADALSRGFLAPFIGTLDTRTPLRNALTIVAVNVAGLLVLALPARTMTQAVLAAGTAYLLAQAASALLAARASSRRFGRLPLSVYRKSLLVLSGTGAVAIVLGWAAQAPVDVGTYRDIRWMLVALSILVLSMGAIAVWRRGLGPALRQLETTNPDRSVTP